MKTLLHCLWLALTITALTGITFLTRYEPIESSEANFGTLLVWDRWHSRPCIVGLATGQRIACSLEEVQEATKEPKIMDAPWLQTPGK